MYIWPGLFERDGNIQRNIVWKYDLLLCPQSVFDLYSG